MKSENLNMAEWSRFSHRRCHKLDGLSKVFLSEGSLFQKCVCVCVCVWGKPSTLSQRPIHVQSWLQWRQSNSRLFPQKAIVTLLCAKGSGLGSESEVRERFHTDGHRGEASPLPSNFNSRTRMAALREERFERRISAQKGPEKMNPAEAL